MNPIVSIVLPTYNRAHVIKPSIDSVLTQTYQNFELIIVDDASTDCTKEIVDSYSDARILYIQSKKNSGAAAARNIGADKARGFYLAFQDSDTIWAPSKLELQMQFLYTPKSPLFFTLICQLMKSKLFLTLPAYVYRHFHLIYFTIY